ncbi:MAG: EamA family transporter RarD [Verrucomicrobia bacterium]|nr:MAG: EamA family transporter RarD [Verrucomicrobiota bacterium]
MKYERDARAGGGDPQHTSAFIAAVASFATWGLVPIYWKLLSRVPALEILAHRFVWTIVFLGLLLSWQERWREVIGNLRRRRGALFCLGSGIMVGLNWLLFIWAVNIGHVLETSLGYFMTPIVNVLLGAFILRERLSAWQTASILIALVAVSILAFGYGHFPWIALGLCTSFGLYGLLRKQSGTAAIPGLFLETLFLLPLALVYLVILVNRGALTFGPSHLALSAILTTSGIVTAVPLIWFGYAARHLRLVTIGFLQYLSPSISFILGLFVYHETFTRQHFITFLLIWFALVLVSTEAVLRWRTSKRVAAEAPPDSPLIEPGI